MHLSTGANQKSSGLGKKWSRKSRNTTRNEKKKRPEGLQKRGSLSACLEGRHTVAFNKNTRLSKQWARNFALCVVSFLSVNFIAAVPVFGTLEDEDFRLKGEDGNIYKHQNIRSIELPEL